MHLIILRFFVSCRRFFFFFFYYFFVLRSVSVPFFGEMSSVVCIRCFDDCSKTKYKPTSECPIANYSDDERVSERASAEQYKALTIAFT